MIRFGLVASLNRPGGNITGVTSQQGAQGAKQLGLLRELVPQAAVIGMLVDPNMLWTNLFGGSKKNSKENSENSEK